MNEQCPSPQPLDAGKLTWAALLGQWVDFARSAVGLPATGQGRRMRDSVPDVIMLQAVWFALGNMEDLSPGERALGLDRAGVLIERHAAALRQRWGADMPEGIAELIAEAVQRCREEEQRTGRG